MMQQLVRRIGNALRDAVPMRRRRRLALLRVRARRPTARLRQLPSAMVIGVQRGGTSSLYRVLTCHPRVARSLRKEIGYFSEEFGRGEAWYRSHFTAQPWKLAIDATPQYLFHPYAPPRAAALLPRAKLIVLLRDPVERAYSHWRHMTNLRFETLSFADAVRSEDERTRGDRERLLADPTYRPTALLRYSYVARGHYVEQVERWMRCFSREQLLVLPSEALFTDPDAVLDRIYRFLGLPLSATPLENHSRPNPLVGGDVARSTIEELRDEFARANRGLSALMDLEPEW